jgi:hypothetical protein
MRQFSDGAIFLRGLTVAEKTAASNRATELGLRSLSEYGAFLIRQDIAQRHAQSNGSLKPAKDLPKPGASRIARKIGQWAIPGQGETERKNSPPARQRNNSPAAVRVSTSTEGA